MVRTSGNDTSSRRVVRTLLLSFTTIVIAPLVLLGALMLGLYAVQLVCELLG